MEPTHLCDSKFFKIYDMNLKEPSLGDGSYSICRKCVHKVTKKAYAVKIISKKVNCEEEVKMLKLCQGHPNIVELYEVYEDALHTYMVMELLTGGELLARVPVTETIAVQVTRQLLSALNHMHSNRVVHRDLKPENMIFATKHESSDVKIVDFGFARISPGDNLNGNSCDGRRSLSGMHTPCFSLPYAAPEVLDEVRGGKSGYGESCDLWSLGVTLYCMLSGKTPFQAASREEPITDFIDRIREGQFQFDGPAWANISISAKVLVRGLLSVDPRRRMSKEQLMMHPWLAANSPTRPVPAAPTRTPSGASTRSSVGRANTRNCQKMKFKLQEVTNAKLAQRRRQNKSSNDNSISSSSIESCSSDVDHRASLSNARASSPGHGALEKVPDNDDLEVMSYTSKSEELLLRSPEITMPVYIGVPTKGSLKDLRSPYIDFPSTERQFDIQNSNFESNGVVLVDDTDIDSIESVTDVSIVNDKCSSKIDYDSDVESVKLELAAPPKSSANSSRGKSKIGSHSLEDVLFKGEVKNTYTRRKPLLDKYMFLDTSQSIKSEDSSIDAKVDDTVVLQPPKKKRMIEIIDYDVSQKRSTRNNVKNVSSEHNSTQSAVNETSKRSYKRVTIKIQESTTKNSKTADITTTEVPSRATRKRKFNEIIDLDIKVERNTRSTKEKIPIIVKSPKETPKTNSKTSPKKDSSVKIIATSTKASPRLTSKGKSTKEDNKIPLKVTKVFKAKRVNKTVIKLENLANDSESKHDNKKIVLNDGEQNFTIPFAIGCRMSLRNSAKLFESLQKSQDLNKCAVKSQKPEVTKRTKSRAKKTTKKETNLPIVKTKKKNYSKKTKTKKPKAPARKKTISTTSKTKNPKTAAVEKNIKAPAKSRSAKMKPEFPIRMSPRNQKSRL